HFEFLFLIIFGSYLEYNETSDTCQKSKIMLCKRADIVQMMEEQKSNFDALEQTLKHDIAALKNDLATFKNDSVTIQKELKKDITALKDGMTSILKSIKDIKVESTHTEPKASTTEQHDGLSKDCSELSDGVTNITTESGREFEAKCEDGWL
ncbi:unnamed protein product, partial [Owenia fusiformis]